LLIHEKTNSPLPFCRIVIDGMPSGVESKHRFSAMRTVGWAFGYRLHRPSPQLGTVIQRPRCSTNRLPHISCLFNQKTERRRRRSVRLEQRWAQQIHLHSIRRCRTENRAATVSRRCCKPTSHDRFF